MHLKAMSDFPAHDVVDYPKAKRAVQPATAPPPASMAQQWPLSASSGEMGPTSSMARSDTLGTEGAEATAGNLFPRSNVIS